MMTQSQALKFVHRKYDLKMRNKINKLEDEKYEIRKAAKKYSETIERKYEPMIENEIKKDGMIKLESVRVVIYYDYNNEDSRHYFLTQEAKKWNIKMIKERDKLKDKILILGVKAPIVQRELEKLLKIEEDD